MTTSTLERIIAAAAEERGQRVHARADRPSQRRWAEDQGAAPIAVVRAPRMELRAAADSGHLHFTGFASVYNAAYEMWDMFGPYTEQVVSGAGAKSLATPDLDVPLVLQHDAMRRIARTLNGSLTVEERTEDDVEGLYVDAPQLDAADVDVSYIAPKLRAGLIDEMSFKFRITRGSWSPDWMEFHIEEYDIHRGDVAIVGYGASPHTSGGLRAELPALGDLTDARLRELESDLHRERKARGWAEPSVPQADLERQAPAVGAVMSRAQLDAIDAMLDD